MSFQGITMSPPSGGLDLVSPIDNMDPAYALELVNVFPGAGAPTVRLGYTQNADIGVSALVKFLGALHKKDATSVLIAGTDTKLYSISTASPAVVTDITGATVPTSGEWQSVVYANNIYLCNGVDNAQVFTGTGTAQDITFTGVAKNALINVTAYKERLYFVEKASAKIWHGGLQVTGTAGTPALTSFDFQYVFTKGGYLVGIGSFSTNTSLTSQDYFYACSSEGEIVFYTGTYASDPTSWGLVARYYIGRPLGYRAFINVNNDVWIITQQGIVPVSGLFQSDPEQALNIVSQKVNPIISDYSTVTPFDHQWTGFFWPQGRRVYVSVPTSQSGCLLLVYAIDTKAWTTFKLCSDEHALSSCLFKSLPFYGSSTGIVWQGETGQADAVTATNSQAITYSGRMAFSFYGSRGNYKAFKDIRPIIKAKRGVTLNLGLDTDFKRSATVTTISTQPGLFTPWGSPWGSSWSSEVEYIFDRFATKGQGHCAAIRFGGSLTNSSMQILGFEVRFDMGGQV